MSANSVQLFIDDQPITAPSGTMLIEVADRHNIDIPRFCYHKKLSIAANCRMCMVEVEKAPKPLPACATPVAEGMKVYTRSPLALDAQKGTMEFLLINHPLDCPVCDQGGECELQDLAMGYGEDVSRYTESKRVVADKELGPLVSTDMTRCIHCTRCVRFGSEIAGIRELGATGRGEFMKIGTYVERALSSELSGNVIDVCPVGALNARPSRMVARSWEMLQAATLAPHDSVGSNLYAHVLRDRIIRIVPKENEQLNETWIADRDRFSYQGVHAADRATWPMVKGDQGWKNTDWDTCLRRVAKQLKQYPAQHLGVLAAPHSTLEELYLLQKIFRRLQVQNIDHRTHQIDFTDQKSMPLFPYLGQSVASVENNDAIFLIGCDIRLEQPMLAHRMRKASASGCEIMDLNPQQFDFYFAHQSTWNLAPQQWLYALVKIARCALPVTWSRLPEALRKIVEVASVVAPARRIFDALHKADRASVLIGAIAASHPQSSALRALANFIANVTNSNFGMLAHAGNSAGAWLCGMLPHRLPGGQASPDVGLHATAMLADPRSAYVLFNLEPEFDFADVPLATQAMHKAEFVVLFTPYVTQSMRDYADVILPIATFAETDGTYVNAAGVWQSVTRVIAPPAQARPAWRILRVLANQLEFADVQFQSSQQIRDELKALYTHTDSFDGNLTDLGNVKLNSDQPQSTDDALGTSNMALDQSIDYLLTPQQDRDSNIYRVSSVPIYAVDNVVRRASALQNTPYAQQPHIAVCRQQAQALNVLQDTQVRVMQGHREMTLPLRLNDALPMHCAWIQTSTRQAEQLGPAIAPIEIQRLAHA